MKSISIDSVSIVIDGPYIDGQENNQIIVSILLHNPISWTLNNVLRKKIKGKLKLFG